MGDILLSGSSSKLIQDLINKLHDKFALKKLGTLQYFLGMEVHRQSNGSMFLTQTKYIKDLFSKVNMYEAKGVHTPMVNNCKLRKHGTYIISDPLIYHSTIGVLQ